MQLRIKKDSSLPVLYSLPLKDGGVLVLEHETLMQELLKGNAIYDHLGMNHPDCQCLVIFYDDFSSLKPQVVKCFVGSWEYIGYTFETAQQYCYKFSPFFEAEAYPADSELKELFQDFKSMFVSFGRTKNLLKENYSNPDSIEQTAGPAT
jgi:hypothetical protein